MLTLHLEKKNLSSCLNLHDQKYTSHQTSFGVPYLNQYIKIVALFQKSKFIPSNYKFLHALPSVIIFVFLTFMDSTIQGSANSIYAHLCKYNFKPSFYIIDTFKSYIVCLFNFIIFGFYNSFSVSNDLVYVFYNLKTCK